MGWSYSHKPKGQTVRSFLEERFNCVNDTGSWKILDCKSSIHEAYLALEVIHTGKERRVIGVVCLLGYDKKSDYNFGFKEMDESMGPYYFNCPASILDKLTPTDNDQSLKWRAKCRENVSKGKALQVGCTVRFPVPISFGVYGKASMFQLTGKKKGIYWCPELGMNVKLIKSTLTNREYEVTND